MYDDVVYEGKFIWNRSKNELNKKRHKINFETASFVTVSFTPRMELTRIFSARKADEKEKDEYLENARKYFA